MIVQGVEGVEVTKVPLNGHLPAGLPAESEVQEIAYVLTNTAAGQTVLMEFPAPIARQAVLVSSGTVSNPPESAAQIGLSLLSIPTSNHLDESLLRLASEWVAVAGSSGSQAQVQLMTLQGAQIIWCAQRVAVLANQDRIKSVRAAMIEAVYYQGELLDIERTLGVSWPQLEVDMPLAFEFNNQAIAKRNQLLHRFQQTLRLRVRLARIASLVHSPHIHPATLASQIAERFRERMRMVHRHEAAGEQLEVFEKVYESCGQRASDFMLSRSSNTLEWVIIVLLLVQVLLGGFEYLATMGK
jgi:hypothetical protein